MSETKDPVYLKFYDELRIARSAISMYRGPKRFLRDLKRVRPELGRVVAVHWCISEVCNGGFLQFFMNPTGVFAPEAAQGFRALRLNSFSALVEEAMASFGKPYPRRQNQRNQRLRKLAGQNLTEYDPFRRLDENFYKLLGPGHKGYTRAEIRYAKRCRR